MCGICGFAYSDPSRPADPPRLRAMRDIMAHRGPDGEGESYHGSVALGHRRLSIIDLATGSQPLANEDHSIWVTFNGEIYNYQELTRDLQQRGHKFRTQSDTEVLVHGYEEYGDQFPARLNGMFAYAVHDLRRNRVLLVRDHFGIKPLFYCLTGEGLFFASEIKSLLAAGCSRPGARPEALAEYLGFRYVAGEESLFSGIKRLPPSHFAVWERSRLSVHSFWNPTSATNSGPKSVDEAVESLDALLARSVQSQMMSEVPLGSFCSGGVDSGLVTAYASKAAPHTMHTFSVGFDDPAWDESALARDTATRYGTEHHNVTARPQEFESLLLSLVWHHDEPLSHPNSVPLYLLSKFARQRVTVVLTGEGSDELFCGYPRYHIARLRQSLNVLPAYLRGALAGFAGFAPGHRARRVADLLPMPLADSYIFNSCFVDPALVQRLTGIALTDVIGERRRLLHLQQDSISTLSQYEIRTYLSCLLDRMDRMSMASSLESRVPFLDVPLAEWALALPSNLKLHGKRNKWTVKRLAERYLSPNIVHGPKSGFGVPLGDWFRSRTFAGLMARLEDPSHAAAQHFDRKVLAGIVAQHSAGQVDHGELLWLLCNVYLWYEVQTGLYAPATGAAALSGVH